jgi:hypothetical protein
MVTFVLLRESQPVVFLVSILYLFITELMVWKELELLFNNTNEDSSKDRLNLAPEILLYIRIMGLPSFGTIEPNL